MADEQRRTSHDPPERVEAGPGAAAPDATVEVHATDLARIDRLASDLLPALVAKLRATGLGEIEVRQDPWKVRVRSPIDGTPEHGRRSTDRPSRAQPGHAGHGHAPAAVEGHRGARLAAGDLAGHSTNGNRPDPPGEGERNRRAMALSPAVGVYQPGSSAKLGHRVRNGDGLGAVDMLGIPQEVIAPADGIVGEILVEAGQPVEFGQELVVIELPASGGGD